MKCPKIIIVVNVAKRRHLANVGSLAVANILTFFTALLTAEDFWFFATSTYNSWLSSIFGTNALSLFLNCKEGPFLRPLRSKDDRCWILRLQPWNFVIISENLAGKLEKVRQTSVWQTVPQRLIAQKSVLKWHNYRMFWSPIIVLSKQIIGDQNIR